MVADGISINLLPPVLSTIQFIDYRHQDKQAAFALFRALNSLPTPQPLPDPLPEPPEAPISYLGKFRDQIESSAVLGFQEQTALLLKLKDRLSHANEFNDVRDLLGRLRLRDDLFAKVADEIDALLTSPRVASPAPKSAPTSSAPPIEIGQSISEPDRRTLSQKSKEWRVELASKGKAMREIHVYTASNMYVIKYLHIEILSLSYTTSISIDDKVVAHAKAYASNQRFDFEITDGGEPYPATIEASLNWLSRLTRFRFVVADRTLFSEG